MSLIKITITDRAGNDRLTEAPTDLGLNLMELCKIYELPVKGTCGGMALCSTCHLYIESDHALPAAKEAEEDMLDQAFFVQSNSRLGCQLRISPDMDGLRVRLAPESED